MTIAIVGCGASCVIILHEMLHEIDKFRYANIVVYEKDTPNGMGIAYSVKDASFIVNTPPERMSINRSNENDYLDWCLKYEKDEMLRVTYGEYLGYSLKKVIAELTLHQVKVTIKQETISDLDLGSNHVILKTEKSVFYADFCIMASGGNIYKPYPHIHHSPRYINCINQLEHREIADKTCAIGIIGSNQSGVDAALYLKSHGHEGPMYMFSNRGLLPKVRQKSQPSTAFNSNLYQIITSEKTFTLKELIAAFEVDMSKYWSNKPVEAYIQNCPTLDWRVFFYDIRKAKGSDLMWQRLMEQLSPFIHDMWLALSENDRRLFFEKYFHHVTRLRGAIPLYNGEKILKLLETKQVKVVKGIIQIAAGNEFTITDSKSVKYNVSYLINAAGIHKKEVIKYLTTLLEKGLATISDKGGIKVDLSTNQLLTANGGRLTNLYAIGYPTSGTFLFINSIELLRIHARKITDQLITQLQTREVRTNVLV